MPIVLQQIQLNQFVDELRQFLPQSLTVLNLAKNHAEQNQFAWPGLEFLVDQFPNHNASLVRPIQNSSEYVPRQHDRLLVFSAKDPESLERFVNQEGIIDWKKPFISGPIWRPLNDTLYSIFSQHGECTGIEKRPDWDAFAIWFEEGKLNPGPPLPSGFSLRPLTRIEVEKVNQVWAFGGTLTTLKYLLYLYDHGFPTMGIFDANNEMAGYVFCGGDLQLIAAYVFPKYRNMGFFHILTYHWCQEMFKLGVEKPFGLVAEPNVPSHTSMLRVGGERANWLITWIIFVPENYDDEDDSLLVWYKKLGGMVWTQK